MTTYLGNAFSIQMLPKGADELKVAFDKVAPSEVAADATSCIGHPDLARVVGSILGREVAANRVSVSLQKGDVLYVAQYVGGRLPEGATELPEGATIEFFKVYLVD